MICAPNIIMLLCNSSLWIIKLRTNDGNTPYCFNNSTNVSSGLLSYNRSRSFRWYSHIFPISYFKRRINSLPPLAINAGGCFVGLCVFHTTSHFSWNEAIISHKISGNILKITDVFGIFKKKTRSKIRRTVRALKGP